jgi:NodT family efflux transporter outer membrane factor (OMF) lipoprotein
MVGPNYKRPAAPVPAAYKEAPPPADNAGAQWNPAQPNDGAVRGKWWEFYQDSNLNALEDQVSISNQNVLQADAQYREAKDTVRIARSSLFPTISAVPGYTNSRTSGTLYNVSAGNLTSGVLNIYQLPVDVSYQIDIWGSIRRTIRADVASAQASFADLENARLTYQAELAEDYFELHGSDSEEQLFQQTVKSYQDYLTLTLNRQAAGVASGADVALARTQLDGARVQLIDLDVDRAQYEHAIAILIGKPPAELTIARAPLSGPPPPLPSGLPSTLLERRPDVAAAERQMAAANEQIGIAKAAYYPTLSLSGSGGFESGSISRLLTWPSRFWSVGPSLSETIFDAGKRHAQVAYEQAAYDSTVATYRQTVLGGFQQVEDNLAALRVLGNEAQAESDAVRDAQQSLDITTYQYKSGVVDYLNVITAQTTLLGDQVNAVNILTRRMTANVLLIEALGGGWNSSALPAPQDLTHGK